MPLELDLPTPGGSVAERVPPRAATFRAAPKPVPIFLLVGAESHCRLFKAAPAVSFRQVKKSLALVSNMT